MMATSHWVLKHTLKTAIASMGLGWGGGTGQEVLCCFGGGTLVKKKTLNMVKVIIIISSEKYIQKRNHYLRKCKWFNG